MNYDRIEISRDAAAGQWFAKFYDDTGAVVFEGWFGEVYENPGKYLDSLIKEQDLY